MFISPNSEKCASNHFVRIMHIIEILSNNPRSPFSAQFMKKYIIVLQIIIVLGYFPMNNISNDYTHASFRYLR
jgi:hypothetical protein